MKITWPKSAVDQSVIVLIISIATIAGAILILELARPIPEECSNPRWHATYIGWDDSAGPCTYLQRTTFNLFYLFVFPTLLAWPLSLITIIGGVYGLTRYKGVRWTLVRKLLLPWLWVLLAWSLFMLSGFM